MNCRRAQASIEKDALGLLSPEEREALCVHMAQCAACREEQAATQAVASRFKGAFAGRSSDAASLAKLRWRIQCEETGGRRAARRWDAIRRFGRFAACLALVVGALFLAWSRIGSACRTGCACHDWQLAGVQPVDASGMAQPLVCGASVFALQQNGRHVRLVAVNRHTGERLWRVSAAFEGGPATDGISVFAWVRGKDGGRQLAAYDAATGRECWRLPYPDALRAARPREIVVGDNGVGWADRTAVTWLEARDGRCKWVAALGVGDTLRPKLAAGPGCVVVVGARQVCALSMERGDVLWSQELDAGVANWLEPRVSSDGTCLAVARTIGPATDRLRCLDLRTGREIWSRETASPAWHLLFQDGVLYVRGQEMMALDGRTGDRLWSLPADGCSPVTLAGGKLYLVAGVKGVLAVDPATGVTLWHSDALASCSGVAVSGRMGYLRTTDGVLHAIRLSASGSGAKMEKAG